MRKMQIFVLIAVAAGLVGCDHATKHAAQSELRSQDPVSLVSGVVDLTYTENRDFAFSALREIPDGVKRGLAIGAAARPGPSSSHWPSSSPVTPAISWIASSAAT